MAKIKLRRDTFQNWYDANPTLASGEPAYDTTNNKLKIGNNVTLWRELEYLPSGVSGSGGTGGTGYTGSVGATGYRGSLGATGYTGSEGATGYNGSVGVTGSVGGTGYSGSVGVTGSVGFKGSVGDGAVGYRGSVGATGYEGSVGYKGSVGAAGSVGYRGSVGASGGSIAVINDLEDVVISSATVGQVLGYNGSQWTNANGGTGGGYTRTTASETTAVIANDVSDSITIVGFKGYGLYKIQTSAAAWVVVYDSAAARTADASRDSNTDPTPGSGVIAEAITTGEQTIKLNPGTMGFNDESPVTDDIPIKVTNLSGGTTGITVTLTLVCLEV
jgi:hypothetical protein